MSVNEANSEKRRLTPELPKPRRSGNQFLELLQRRRSSRTFAARPLELQVLSDVLWAAFGVSNRDGYRTAPSARNWREIDIYVSLAEGLFRFNPHAEALECIVHEDIRAHTGLQDYVPSAPANLVYVADHSRMDGASAIERDFYSAADTGVISQNVYLYCASEGLATVVRGLIDRPALARHMKLRPDQRVVLAQSLGYPPEELSVRR